jgi:hypothetical protein
MNATSAELVNRNWTAVELLKLPAHERDAILAAAAARALNDYASDEALTGFDAFGEADLHGHSSDSEPR